MTSVTLACVWFAVVSLALLYLALAERRARVAERADRSELAPPRARWGSDLDVPPAASLLPRALAGGARLVRSRTLVDDHARGLRASARAVSCVALASALSLVPFAGRLGGTREGRALVVVDLENGLFALVFLVLLAGMAQVGIGLSDRSVWSRIGSVRVASRMLGGIGLLMLVLLPLSIDTGSLRLADLVAAQRATFVPFGALLASLSGPTAEWLGRWPWPAWHLLSQPLTAVLFVPAMGFLTRRPVADDPVSGGFATSGFGFDAEPADLYWERVESRLALVLFGALLVSLFLGAGHVPYLDTARIVAGLEGFVGHALASMLVAGFEISVFVLKLCVVLGLLMWIRRVTASLREDQWLRIMTRRLLPLAWANLLLVAALSLLDRTLAQTGAP